MIGTMAILMCTWVRPDKFAHTIQMLSRQSDQDFEFHVWNNNLGICDILHKAIEDWKPQFPISITNSEKNIGEVALLRMGGDIRHSQGIRYAITIDDDEIFDADMVATFRREAAPKTISSYWAWRFTRGKGYYTRTRSKPGEGAHYCGFGGTVFDADFFIDPRVQKPVDVFWMDGRVILTDLWASYVAHELLEWTLMGSAAKIWIEKDGKDQSIGLFNQKNIALSHLRSMGWGI